MKEVLRVYRDGEIENGKSSMAVKTSVTNLVEMVHVWTAITRTLIDMMEKNGNFVGGIYKSLHGLLNEVIKQHLASKEGKKSSEKSQTFEDFKESFLEEDPKARRMYEEAAELEKAAYDALLKVAYINIKEGH